VAKTGEAAIGRPWSRVQACRFSANCCLSTKAPRVAATARRPQAGGIINRAMLTVAARFSRGPGRDGNPRQPAPDFSRGHGLGRRNHARQRLPDLQAALRRPAPHWLPGGRCPAAQNIPIGTRPRVRHPSQWPAQKSALLFQVMDVSANVSTRHLANDNDTYCPPGSSSLTSTASCSPLRSMSCCVPPWKNNRKGRNTVFDDRGSRSAADG
jgi:hypothetical protein